MLQHSEKVNAMLRNNGDKQGTDSTLQNRAVILYI